MDLIIAEVLLFFYLLSVHEIALPGYENCILDQGYFGLSYVNLSPFRASFQRTKRKNMNHRSITGLILQSN